MDKRTFTIGVLSIMATVMMCAIMIQSKPAIADGVSGFAAKDNRYQLIVTRSEQGGNTVYVIDNTAGTNGMVANLSWQNGKLVPIAIQPLSELLNK